MHEDQHNGYMTEAGFALGCFGKVIFYRMTSCGMTCKLLDGQKQVQNPIPLLGSCSTLVQFLKAVLEILKKSCGNRVFHLCRTRRFRVWTLVAEAEGIWLGFCPANHIRLTPCGKPWLSIQAMVQRSEQRLSVITWAYQPSCLVVSMPRSLQTASGNWWKKVTLV